jgi:hypothetical protein
MSSRLSVRPLGEYGNQLGDELLVEVRQLIEAAVEQLRAEFSRQLDQLRSEFTAQTTELFESVALIHTQGDQLKAQLEAIVAKKTRARSKANGGSLLQLPAPTNGNGDAHGTQ